MDTSPPTPQKPKFIAVITVRHTSANRLTFTRSTELGPFKTADDAEYAVLRYHPTKGELLGAIIHCVGATETVRVECLSASEIFKRWQTKVYPYAR